MSGEYYEKTSKPFFDTHLVDELAAAEDIDSGDDTE